MSKNEKPKLKEVPDVNPYIKAIALVQQSSKNLCDGRGKKK